MKRGVREKGTVSRVDEVILEGLSVSAGIGMGAPLFLTLSEDELEEFPLLSGEVESEVERYKSALDKSREDVEALKVATLSQGPSEMAEILGAHLEMLKDPYLTHLVEERIRLHSKSTESVFRGMIDEYKRRFRNLRDGHFQERIRDIVDVSRRVLGHLRPIDRPKLSELKGNTIVLAHDLVPTDTVEADASRIRGFITAAGGHTSHAAIIARAKGIPYVAHVDIQAIHRTHLQQLIVDGTRGRIILNPTPQTLKRYQAMQRGDRKVDLQLQTTARLMPETIDGFQTKIYANLESLSEVKRLVELGAEGVGLFRSEYLFLAKGRFPTEEEQVAIYRNLVKKLKGRPLTIRIFDVGGDKQVEGVTLVAPERNPALGCRAIRFLLKFPEILETQLRAILRASEEGPVHVLIPMVTDLSELRWVKERIQGKLPVGCMIEVPASAVLADAWAREADFLSIGTNDLVQYTLATDRNNPHTAPLYLPHHPSLLRLIRGVIEACAAAHKPLLLCGESAADPMLIPLFLGLGIRSFSVAVRHIPRVKDTLRKWTVIDAFQLAEEALKASTAEELEQLLKISNLR